MVGGRIDEVLVDVFDCTVEVVVGRTVVVFVGIVLLELLEVVGCTVVVFVGSSVVALALFEYAELPASLYARTR